MEINQDYLAKIYEGEQIFVIQDKQEAAEYNLEDKSPVTDKVKEPQVELKPVAKEGKTSYKDVVILVNHNLGSEEKQTLGKLLKAINIEEGQYDIIYEHPEQLKSVQHLKLFLSFHNEYVQSADYSILKINKGNAIYAHGLADLNKDNSKKLMLWNLLKTIV